MVKPRPRLLIHQDNQPMSASSFDVLQGAPSGCRLFRSGLGRHGQADVLCSPVGRAGLHQGSFAPLPGIHDPSWCPCRIPCTVMLREWRCSTWVGQVIALKGKHNGSYRLKVVALGEFQQPDLKGAQGEVLSSSSCWPGYSRQIRQDQFPPILHVSVRRDARKVAVRVSKRTSLQNAPDSRLWP